MLGEDQLSCWEASADDNIWQRYGPCVHSPSEGFRKERKELDARLSLRAAWANGLACFLTSSNSAGWSNLLNWTPQFHSLSLESNPSCIQYWRPLPGVQTHSEYDILKIFKYAQVSSQAKSSFLWNGGRTSIALQLLAALWKHITPSPALSWHLITWHKQQTNSTREQIMPWSHLVTIYRTLLVLVG